MAGEIGPVMALRSLGKAYDPGLDPEDLGVEEGEDDVRDDDAEGELEELLGGALVPEAVLEAADGGARRGRR